MPKPLASKVQETVRYLRDLWPRLENKYRFVAFSTGKDSLAMTAMLYEAVAPEKPVCLYSHHDLEFPINLEYLEELRTRGFVVKVVNPFLEYFELMERGIGFLWIGPTASVATHRTRGGRATVSAIFQRSVRGITARSRRCCSTAD